MVSSFARADDSPSHPITMVVPVSAGGALDTMARMVAERMRASLGQPVVIENVTGASGTIGTGRVARAAPDGYTLIYGANVTHVVNAAVCNLNYDVLTDFEPVALIGETPWLIVARKTCRRTTCASLIAWLKANPDKATLGTAGTGSPSHIAGVLFQKVTGTRFQFVPYRGGAPVMQDLVGRADRSVDPRPDHVAAADSRRQHQSLRRRWQEPHRERARYPDRRTRPGCPAFYMSHWQAIWAPKGTPKDVIAKLNAAVVDAWPIRHRARGSPISGYEIPRARSRRRSSSRAFHKAEIEKWWPIIKAAGIKGGGVNAIALASHLENLAVARLDLLALRQHRGGIGLQQLQRRQRRAARLLLDLRMERAMRVIVDQQLLAFRAEEETLEQPRRIRIGRAAEHAARER